MQKVVHTSPYWPLFVLKGFRFWALFGPNEVLETHLAVIGAKKFSGAIPLRIVQWAPIFLEYQLQYCAENQRSIYNLQKW